MKKQQSITHLLTLLDDDSSVVREAVSRELVKRQTTLQSELRRNKVVLDAASEELIQEILEPSLREHLEKEWLSWLKLEDNTKQLEQALNLLSVYFQGWKGKASQLTEALDDLAAQYVDEGLPLNVESLAQWLFSEEGLVFEGNTKNYYSPENSDLLWVIRERKGNPLSLCCIYRLVGYRLGLSIEGCNFPGHFLARVVVDDEVYLVDCFNRGRFLKPEEVAKHHPTANSQLLEVLENTANTSSIVLRIIRNLDDAFDRKESIYYRHMMRRLAIQLMSEENEV
jgi:regulator of sirC expression with transglutaminase-like and TPR domain